MNFADIELLMFLNHFNSKKVSIQEILTAMPHYTRKELYASLDRLDRKKWISKEYTPGLTRKLLISIAKTGIVEINSVLSRVAKYFPVRKTKKDRIDERVESKQEDLMESVRETIINELVDYPIPANFTSELVNSLTRAIVKILGPFD